MELSRWKLDVALGVTALLVMLLFITRAWRITVPKGLRLPDGPKGRFFVGNVADMPTHHEWETFSQWAKDYGPLTYLKIFGQPIISVSSLEVARDLFDTRSSKYSDRSDTPMMEWDLIDEVSALAEHERLMTFHVKRSFALMHYGDRWRRHRKAFHSNFHILTVSTFHEIQVKHTRNALRRLSESPDEFTQHFRHLTGATIMEIIYGIKVLPARDPYIDLAEELMEAVAEAGNAGAFLVDNLPILKYVPAWMPGAEFKRKARAWRVLSEKVCKMPFMAVKRSFHSGTAGNSVMASLLEGLSDETADDVPADTEEVIRNTAAVAYLAGSDTIGSVLEDFVLAMVLYPEVQQKAQVELSSVLGMERLPRFEDRKDLPYIDALCKEALRWHPVAPLGLAHRVMEDDVYGDHFIPGGSIVFGNVWAILHDEKIYGPDTREFKPERFLVSGARYPDAAFGFGRRICPGRHTADNSIFIAVASILQVFNISHAKDDVGNDIPVKAAFKSGLLSRPEPFRCLIKPRSVQAEALVAEYHGD